MMTKHAKEMSTGELARRSGIATSAVRFYESQGLIRSRRSAGNQRRFHRATLRRVAFIRASQQVGISLQAIGEVLGFLGEDEAPTEETWARASECWAVQLDERISTLVRMRERLTSCVACGCLSLRSCQLINPDDELGGEGPGPRRLIHD